MNSAVALFPGLLGAAFDRLDAPVRQLHRGSGGTWQGRASVTRGRGWPARLACFFARLPPDMQDAPLRFELRATANHEVWTRWFGNAPAMCSRLWPGQGCLEERLGPAKLRFALREADGALHWQATSVQVLGLSLPRRAFDIRARIGSLDGRYHFAIEAGIAGIGALIRYEGTLHA